MDVYVPYRLANLSTRELGAIGEEAAARYLSDQGYVVVDRNWRCSFGELDIVAASPDGVAVFVEVKTRRTCWSGIPQAAVTQAKCKKLRQLAGAWMAERKPRARDMRIDVVALEATGQSTLALTHLRSVA